LPIPTVIRSPLPPVGNAVLKPADTPVGTLPYWDWEVAKNKVPYHPYIVQPTSWDAGSGTLGFQLILPTTLKPYGTAFTLMVLDPEGDEIVPDVPGTVMQWVRDGKPPGKFCLLFLVDAIASTLKFPPDSSVRKPDDKWPKTAATSAGPGDDAASPRRALAVAVRKVLDNPAALTGLSEEDLAILQRAAQLP
jgi:hypothetical protein